MQDRLKVFLLLLLLPLLTLGCKKPEEAPAESKESKESAAASKDMPSASSQPALPPTPSGGPALKIAYSDWPGWVAWEIAIQKGWFKEEGVEVDFKWFEYVPSMEAYSAGKVDACAMTNGDALVTGSSGSPSVAILLNDYSNGNDMIVAKSGIEKVEQLKGNIGR